ncbi:carboxypeptidase regulatory-like domain-containing protein [Granulicella cerasi]|uniref:Carboxypeptidase regulatory-like domain-containing protein n=1 Tax=Granulicella cerasi TaxID=741063 RepID=A0ABW1Z9F5_9BACT|nr:TonB-dependent receptor [Granulicella cerasi]
MTFRNQSLGRWLCCAVLLSASLAARAQRDQASVTGIVKDASGATVPNVQVIVENTDTGVKTTTNTDSSGFYRIFNLPIGHYIVHFTHEGFRPYDRTGIMLSVSQVAEIDAKMLVGAQTEVVQVTTQAPLLQTEDAKMEVTLENETVTDMPLSIQGGRTLSTFMFAYMPGVEGSDYASHVNGSPAMTKEVMIDGTSAVSQLGGYLSESQPPMEAINQFQVDTAGIRATDGRTGGGVFKYEMKSGTNDIHGAVFGFLRNSVFDANDWFNKYTYGSSYPRPSDNMSQWGLGVGGPLIKDKLFWYGAFERYMFSNFSRGGLGSVVPNAAFLNGDLSALLNKTVTLGTDSAGNTIYQGAIFDPTTGNVFVNNQIPTTRFSNVSKNIIQLYQQYYQPIANPTPGAAGNNAMPSQTLPWEHISMVSGKIDYYLSKKDHFGGSYIYNSSPRILADQGGIWSYSTPNGGPMANSYDHFVHAPSARIAWFHTVNDHLLNTARFTFNRFYNPSKAISGAGNWDSKLGLGTYGSGNFPKITFGGSSYLSTYNMSSLGSQFNDFYAANTFIYNDDLSWVIGRNTLTMGVEFRAQQFNSHADSGVLSVDFDAAQTGAPNASYATSVGHSFASFLLGATNSAGVSQPNQLYGRRKSFSAYVSDDLKLTSKLTLNFDLRWDWNAPYKEKNGHWSSFNPTAANSVTGVPGALQFLSNGDQSWTNRQVWTNFAPHVGAAYQITPKTVLRGSFSIFYTPLNLNSWGAVPYSFDPGYVPSSQIQPSGQRLSKWQNWDTPYSNYATFTNAVKNPAYTQWGMVQIDPRMLTPGNTQQFMAGVQRDLGGKWVGSIDYIGNHSYHLQTSVLSGNQPSPSAYAALATRGTQWNWVSDAASAAAAGVPYPYQGFAGSAYMAITPNPLVATSYGPLFVVGSPVGNANYQSMQILVKRTAGNGLSMMASYVLSKAHGDTDSNFQELWWTGSVQNIYDRNRERNTVASFDQTHIVKGYISYILPFGRGRQFLGGSNRFVDSLVNNWMFNGDFHYASGTPMQVFSSNYYPGFNNVYANIVPGCNMVRGNKGIGGQYLNTSCFQNPNAAVGQLGNGSNFYDNARNIGLATEDLGIIKGINITADGRVKLQLRGDFFNIFNRRGLGAVDASMTSVTFGKVIGEGGPGPRTGQVGARISF